MKKAFNIVAGVCTIVLMSILLIGGLVLLAAISGTGGATLITAIIALILLFCTATIIIAALAIAKPKGKLGLGLKITVIVLIGIIAVLEFVGDGIVYGFLCLIPIGFEIASICIKESAPKPDIADSNNSAPTGGVQSVDEKIAEIKHLKELNVISEEQYNEAIAALVNEIKNS